jgi:hypothetical protein
MASDEQDAMVRCFHEMRPGKLKVKLYCLHLPRIERYMPIFLTLAKPDLGDGVGKVQVRNLQVRQLACSQPGPVTRMEDGAVADVNGMLRSDRRQDQVNFLPDDGTHQRLVSLWATDVTRRIPCQAALGVYELIETSDCAEFPPGALGGDVPVQAVQDELAYVVRRRLQDVFLEGLAELVQIDRVGRNAVAGVGALSFLILGKKGEPFRSRRDGFAHLLPTLLLKCGGLLRTERFLVLLRNRPAGDFGTP